MSNQLIALELAVAAADRTLTLLARLPARYRHLAEQGERAVTSAPLNLAEGSGRTGRARRYHYEVAYGSSREAKVLLRVLLLRGLVDAQPAEAALDLIDRCCAATWRLLHPRQR